MSGESMREMHPLFQVGDGGSTPTSPLQMTVRRIIPARAIVLNQLWHSRLPKLSLSNICRNKRYAFYGAEFEGIWYASAVWTSPSARLLPDDWLELKRLAIAEDAPKNTASWMISRMVQKLKKRFPEIVKLISYQDTEVHLGTIYKASGWKIGAHTKFASWTSSRKRNPDQSKADKVRWEKDIR